MMKYLRYILIAFACITTGPVYVCASEPIGENLSVDINHTIVKPLRGCIEITVTDDIEHDATVYALTGQVVKHLIVREGVTCVELNPGYYIVRIDGMSQRVVVR